MPTTFIVKEGFKMEEVMIIRALQAIYYIYYAIIILSYCTFILSFANNRKSVVGLMLMCINADKRTLGLTVN